MLRFHLINDRLVLLQILHLLRFALLIVRLNLKPCDLPADIFYLLLALSEIVDGVAKVQEMLCVKRDQGIPIRSIVAIVYLEFKLVADAAALEASVCLFFGCDFGENFEHPAVHDVVGLFGERDEEAAFCAGRD